MDRRAHVILDQITARVTRTRTVTPVVVVVVTLLVQIGQLLQIEDGPALFARDAHIIREHQGPLTLALRASWDFN